MTSEPEGSLASVPRPPILTRPKRANGRLRVVMEGVTCRIAMHFAGLEGTGLEAIDVAGEEVRTGRRRKDEMSY